VVVVFVVVLVVVFVVVFVVAVTSSNHCSSRGVMLRYMPGLVSWVWCCKTKVSISFSISIYSW
jgi:hypothetical protein